MGTVPPRLKHQVGHSLGPELRALVLERTSAQAAAEASAGAWLGARRSHSRRRSVFCCAAASGHGSAPHLQPAQRPGHLGLRRRRLGLDPFRQVLLRESLLALRVGAGDR